jgi:hypothetical protein
VITQQGSTVDIRGGGDLYAYRSVLGIGGSADRLGTAAAPWDPNASYKSGDLVVFNGESWSARVPSQGEQPSVNLFWSRIEESFAILPTFKAEAAPFNPFNTGILASQLQQDPGFVFTPDVRGERVFTSLASVPTARRTNPGTQVGGQIYLDATPGLDAGTYTLLPRRYALLPGAFLVTPQAGEAFGTFNLPEGASLTTGYRVNSFTPDSIPALRTRYEVASSDVTRARSSFVDYLANDFFAEAAQRLEIERPQLLPVDAGSLALHGNSKLVLNGGVLTGHPGAGRGATIDVSSFADIAITQTGGAPKAGDFNPDAVRLSASTLSSWGAESLLIGGLRRLEGDRMTVEVRTSELLLDNAGSTFSGARNHPRLWRQPHSVRRLRDHLLRRDVAPSGAPHDCRRWSTPARQRRRERPHYPHGNPWFH